jgi:hypothetical protein
VMRSIEGRTGHTQAYSCQPLAERALEAERKEGSGREKLKDFK